MKFFHRRSKPARQQHSVTSRGGQGAAKTAQQFALDLPRPEQSDSYQSPPGPSGDAPLPIGEEPVTTYPSLQSAAQPALQSPVSADTVDSDELVLSDIRIITPEKHEKHEKYADAATFGVSPGSARFSTGPGSVAAGAYGSGRSGERLRSERSSAGRLAAGTKSAKQRRAGANSAFGKKASTGRRRAAKRTDPLAKTGSMALIVAVTLATVGTLVHLLILNPLELQFGPWVRFFGICALIISGFVAYICLLGAAQKLITSEALRTLVWLAALLPAIVAALGSIFVVLWLVGDLQLPRHYNDATAQTGGQATNARYYRYAVPLGANTDFFYRRAAGPLYLFESQHSHDVPTPSEQRTVVPRSGPYPDSSSRAVPVPTSSAPTFAPSSSVTLRDSSTLGRGGRG